MSDLRQEPPDHIVLAHIGDARTALAELRRSMDDRQSVVAGIGAATHIAEAVDALDLAEAAMRGLKPCS